jgi:hypothetical protein
MITNQHESLSIRLVGSLASRRGARGEVVEREVGVRGGAGDLNPRSNGTRDLATCARDLVRQQGAHRPIWSTGSAAHRRSPGAAGGHQRATLSGTASNGGIRASVSSLYVPMMRQSAESS